MQKFFSFILLVIIAVAAALIYYPDKPLDLEAEAWLQSTAPQVAPERNLYLALMGFYVAEDKDPQQEAARLIVAANSAIQTARSARDYRILSHDPYWETPPLGFQGVSPGACTLVDKGCAKIFSDQSQTILDAVDKNTVLLARYWRLYEIPEYENTLLPDAGAPRLRLNGLLHANELSAAYAVALYASGAQSQAVSLLQEDIAFLRRLLAEADVLLLKTAAAGMLKNSLLVYSELMDLGGEGDFDALRELQLEERGLAGVLRREFQRAAADLRYNLVVKVGADLEIPRWLVRPIAKPNHGINLQLMRYRRLALYDQLSGQELLTRYQSGEIDRPESLAIEDYLSDPVGSLLLRRNAPSYGDVYARMLDLESLVRLVNLKHAIKRNAVNAKNLPAYLEQAPANLRNPYTGEAGQWNEAKGVLYYDSVSADSSSVAVRLRF